MTTTQTATKKITLTTLKSFVAKNRGELQLLVSSTFDSMVDGVRPTEAAAFKPVVATSTSQVCSTRFAAAYDQRTTLGIKGIWLVGGSRNWFQAFNSATHTGFTVSNCCGTFTVAVPVR